jgi:hypothetical protein
VGVNVRGQQLGVPNLVSRVPTVTILPYKPVMPSVPVMPNSYTVKLRNGQLCSDSQSIKTFFKRNKTNLVSEICKYSLFRLCIEFLFRKRRR